MADNDVALEKKLEDNLAVGAKSGAIAFGLKMSSTALGFLNQVLLARLLGAGGLGEVLLAVSVVRISSIIAKFGLEDVMMRFVPVYIDRKDSARLQGSINFTLVFCLLLSIGFVFLVEIFAKFISVDIFHSEGLRKLLPLVAVVIPATAVRDVIGGILKGYRDTFRALLPEYIIAPLFRIMIFLALTLKGASPLYAIVAYIAGEIIAVVLSMKFMMHRVKQIAAVKRIYEHKRIMNVAYTFILTNISILLYTQADVWILGMFTSTKTVGIYGIAGRLVFLTYFPILAYTAVIPSIISSIHDAGDRGELRKVARESTRWILSMAMPIVLVIVFEGKFILRILFGLEFEVGYTALLILTAGQLMRAGSGLVGAFLQMTGEHKIYLKINIFWGIMNVIMNVLLVPQYGMIGAALATACCLSMIDVTSIIVVHKRLSVLTLARGFQFDIIFIAAIAITQVIISYAQLELGSHILLAASLIIYLWKSISSHDIPWRVLFAKQ